MTQAIRLSYARPAAVDRLRQPSMPVAYQATLVVAAALLTALAAQVGDLRVYGWIVPLTLQTLVVYGSGLFLGWRNGLLAQALYVALGLVLPFYTGGASGLEYAMGATGGYLVGFPLAAMTIGLVSRHWNSLAGTFLATYAGSCVLFACGVSWLVFGVGVDAKTAVVNGWLAFIVFDLAKIAIVSMAYTGSRRLTRR